MDPITIGIAFSAAQAAVGHIKQAIALGKDVHSLAGQFNKFFESADAIHRQRSKEKFKAQRLGKTDAELGQLALQTAMHSDSLREAERQLKDMIIWELGKPQLWEDMIKERTRLFKERAQAEREEAERERERKKKLAEQIMFSLYFVGFAIFIFCASVVGLKIYAAVQEKQEYEAKQAQRLVVLSQQRKAREAQEKAEREKYAGGSN